MTTKNIENIIEDNMMGYASYVLLDRCLPRFEDGMKPVHRRILYSMFIQKAFKFTKSANVAGQIMKLHPHGSTYGSMVGMVQKDRHSSPMLEGKGNFGQYTSRDISPAADRYSEVKLSEVSIDMMKDFDKGIVDFIDNYDGTMRMPEVLPVKFPTILTYAQSGIGVGFSSSIASFNLVEVCDSTINYIQTGDHTTLVPDFATGGSIVNEPEVFQKINSEGNGTVKIRGKAEIEGNEILITEIPYSTTREAIIDKVIELAKSGKLKEVTDIKDLTGLKGMLISVTARKNTDMNVLLEKLYRFTPLQSTYSSNMNILINDLPRVMGTSSIIEEWVKWRRQSIERGLKYDIKKMSDSLHILRGLEKVLLDIDKAIEIIRRSKENEIEINLQSSFEIDFDQAKEIANMKLRNINKEYIAKKIKDIEKLEEKIKNYKDIVGNEARLNDFVIEGLEETKKKYGQSRRTKVIEIENRPVVHLVQEVQNYPVIIHLTEEGYIYKFRGAQEPHLKPGDSVKKIFETMNDSQILIFTKDNECYKLETSKVEETRVTQLGHYIPNLLRNNKIEVVNYSILDDRHKLLIAAYSNNRVSKINLASFNGNRRILKNAYNRNQELVDLITLEDESTLKIVTDKTSVKVDTSNLRLTNSRGSTGVYTTRKGETQKIEIA